VIVLDNNDDQFYDLPNKILEIVYQLLHNPVVHISVNYEGPDLARLRLYDILTNICSTFNIPTSKFVIHTRNLIESSNVYSIQVTPPYSFAKFCQDYVGSNHIPTKKFASITPFGIFIGRSNWQRLWLASHLYSKYRNSLAITYHYDRRLDYHGVNLGLDTLVYEAGVDIIPQASYLLQATPLMYDAIEGYPIDGLKKTVPSIDLASRYGDFFVEIVCETYTAGTSFFPTEKTWRPIMCKTPFIIQGPQNFLANLKALGIKTFDQWWDESYDYQPGRTKIEEIIKIIDMLARKSELELETMYNEMLPILEHNYNVLMQLTPKQMLTATYVK
jgi:hypothetical protein